MGVKLPTCYFIFYALFCHKMQYKMTTWHTYSGGKTLTARSERCSNFGEAQDALTDIIYPH
jgi:hypothetical protein